MDLLSLFLLNTNGAWIKQTLSFIRCMLFFLHFISYQLELFTLDMCIASFLALYEQLADDEEDEWIHQGVHFGKETGRNIQPVR